MKKIKNCHKSKLLDSYIGKRVKITFFDGTENIGVLEIDKIRDMYRLMRYDKVSDILFYKSHIRKIQKRM